MDFCVFLEFHCSGLQCKRGEREAIPHTSTNPSPKVGHKNRGDRKTWRFCEGCSDMDDDVRGFVGLIGNWGEIMNKRGSLSTCPRRVDCNSQPKKNVGGFFLDFQVRS